MAPCRVKRISLGDFSLRPGLLHCKTEKTGNTCFYRKWGEVCYFFHFRKNKKAGVLGGLVPSWVKASICFLFHLVCQKDLIDRKGCKKLHLQQRLGKIYLLMLIVGDLWSWSVGSFMLISFPKGYGSNLGMWDVILGLISLKYSVSCDKGQLVRVSAEDPLDVTNVC